MNPNEDENNGRTWATYSFPNAPQQQHRIISISGNDEDLDELYEDEEYLEYEEGLLDDEEMGDQRTLYVPMVTSFDPDTATVPIIILDDEEEDVEMDTADAPTVAPAATQNLTASLEEGATRLDNHAHQQSDPNEFQYNMTRAEHNEERGIGSDTLLETEILRSHFGADLRRRSGEMEAEIEHVEDVEDITAIQNENQIHSTITGMRIRQTTIVGSNGATLLGVEVVQTTVEVENNCESPAAGVEKSQTSETEGIYDNIDLLAKSNRRRRVRFQDESVQSEVGQTKTMNNESALDDQVQLEEESTLIEFDVDRTPTHPSTRFQEQFPVSRVEYTTPGLIQSPKHDDKSSDEDSDDTVKVDGEKLFDLSSIIGHNRQENDTRERVFQNGDEELWSMLTDIDWISKDREMIYNPKTKKVVPIPLSKSKRREVFVDLFLGFSKAAFFVDLGVRASTILKGVPEDLWIGCFSQDETEELANAQDQKLCIEVLSRTKTILEEMFLRGLMAKVPETEREVEAANTKEKKMQRENTIRELFKDPTPRAERWMKFIFRDLVDEMLLDYALSPENGLRDTVIAKVVTMAHLCFENRVTVRTEFIEVKEKQDALDKVVNAQLTDMFSKLGIHNM